jgi:glycogen debranching enzyme
LIRILEVLSVTPAFLKGSIDKTFYLRHARNSRNVSANLQEQFLDSTAHMLDGSKLNPAGYYTGVWCRDASYMLNELLEMNDVQSVAKQLEWIWRHQITGSIKVVHGRGSPLRKYRLQRVPDDLRVRFKGALPTSIQHGYCEIYGESPDVDSTALMVSSTCKFLIARGANSVDTFEPRIREALAFLESKDIDGDGLLEQGPNEDWMDSMLRSGKIVYSQALWALALIDWSELLHKLGNSKEAEESLLKAERVKEQVNTKLWNDGLSCFCDDLDNSAQMADDPSTPRVTQDSAFFLLLETPKSQRALQALDRMKSELWNNKVGPYCIHPPAKTTGPFVLSPYKYQNGAFWPWITAVEILARLRHGQIEESNLLMERAILFASIEWVNPNTLSAGSYPFRTSIASVRSASRRVKMFKK